MSRNLNRETNEEPNISGVVVKRHWCATFCCKHFIYPDDGLRL